MIDRHRGQAGIDAVENRLIFIPPDHPVNLSQPLREKRKMRLDLRQNGLRGKQKDPAIPEVLTALKIPDRRREIRLFDKPRHVATLHPLKAREVRQFRPLGLLLARLNVSITGLRAGWKNAKGDDRPSRGKLRRRRERLREGGAIGNEVIGRQHDQRNARIAASPVERCQPDAGRRVTPKWLDHYLHRSIAQQPMRNLFVQLSDDHRDTIRRNHWLDSRNRLLEHRPFPGDPQKLLRQCGATRRPEPRSRSTRHYDRIH